MRLLFAVLLVLHLVSQPVSTIIPCWDQDDVQVFMVTRHSEVIPIAVSSTRLQVLLIQLFVGASVLINLSDKLQETVGGIIEIRKPQGETSGNVHCRIFNISEDKSARMIKRLINGFAYIPEVELIQIKGMDVLVCLNVRPVSNDAAPIHLVSVSRKNRKCDHAVVLKTTKGTSVSLFRFMKGTIHNQRAVIKIIFDVFFKILGLSSDFEIEVFNAESGKRPAEGAYFIASHWPSSQLNVASMLDYIVSTEFLSSVSYIVVSQNAHRTTVLAESNSVTIPTEPDEVIGLVKSLSVMQEPCFVGPPAIPLLNVEEALVNCDNGLIFEISKPDYVLDNDTLDSLLVLQIHVPEMASRRRLLYLYLSLLSGPLSDKFDFVEVSCQTPKACRLDIIATTISKKLEVANALKRVSVLAQIELLPIFYIFIRMPSGEVLKAPLPITNALVQEISRSVVTARPVAPGTLIQSSLSSLFEYGVIDVYKSDDLRVFQDGNHQLLNKRERKMLGLLPEATIKRTYVDTQPDHDPDFESDFDNDEKLEDASLDDVFVSLSRSLTEIRIKKLRLESEFANLSHIARDCNSLLADRQHLVIIEQFYRLKGALNNLIPQDSCFFKEMEKPSSSLSLLLGSEKYTPYRSKIIQAMRYVQNNRRKLSEPVYDGRPFFWIKSKKLKSLFFMLFKRYHKVECNDHDFELRDIEGIQKPPLVTTYQVEELRSAIESAQSECASIANHLRDLKASNGKCLEASKNREVLMMGSIFKALKRDLISIARDKPLWLHEAKTPGSHVHERMIASGVPDYASLKLILSFLVNYRNAAAHPDPHELEVGNFPEHLQPLLHEFSILSPVISDLQKLSALEI